MSPEIRKSLFDMHNAVLGIELFTQGKTVRDLEGDDAVWADPLLRAAGKRA